MKRFSWLVPTLYIAFLMLPIYWLVNMSLRTTNDILGGFKLFPTQITFDSYRTIFVDPTWYMGYVNSLSYVLINTVLSVCVALPAAYAFSRYRFLGDKHLFFWLLTNRMAPAAVFALPFLQLYSAVGLFDTYLAVALAHTLFNIPLAVWILEGFMSGVPKELDETAYVDGYSFPAFFTKIFTDPTWYNGYFNSLTYVIINTVISVTAALPAAYAFSRYRFLGDKHLFFWLLTNRMAPPAVFALPFFQLYSAVGLFASRRFLKCIASPLGSLRANLLVAHRRQGIDVRQQFLPPRLIWRIPMIGKCVHGEVLAPGAQSCGEFLDEDDERVFVSIE
jgi:ABC-type glycerol-3-phosphate transport system permease component